MTTEGSFIQPTIPCFDGHYDHWSILMENFLWSKEYWTVVVSGIAEPTNGVVQTDAQKAELEGQKLKDLKAKNYLFQDIDHSILETILCKDTSKHIWDSMKKKYQGTTRAKRQQLQALRSEFELLRMKSGESVTDYFSRMLAIVNKMRIYGDKTEDVIIVEKILRSLTPNYNFVVCSIEEANDLDELSIDELQGSLLVHEQKIIQVDKEEQALKASTNYNAWTVNRSADLGRGRGRGGRGNSRVDATYFQNRGRGRNQQFDKSEVECFRCHKFGHYRSECYTKLPNEREKGELDKSDVECFRCHKFGHYRSECYTKLPNDQERGEQSNFAEKKEVETLLMTVQIDEQPQGEVWYVDTGCSNHMCGSKSSFCSLNEGFHSTVSFGDCSTVRVMEKGDINIRTKNGFVATIFNVFYVPDLKSNLLSVGQLQEKGLYNNNSERCL